MKERKSWPKCGIKTAAERLFAAVPTRQATEILLAAITPVCGTTLPGVGSGQLNGSDRRNNAAFYRNRVFGSPSRHGEDEAQ